MDKINEIKMPHSEIIETVSLPARSSKKYSRIYPEEKAKLFEMVCF